ncbi:hypothetical protein SLS64_003663 [Diaporthe eres]|uniref:Low affinity iron transporter n=1 Tax=Diaporthe eres TaxID=83184 RepID=A0ABR1NTH5_DIAER
MQMRLIDALRAPGFKGSIEEAAPTQHVLVMTSNSVGRDSTLVDPVLDQYAIEPAAKPKGRRLDRWLDRLVQASGSEPIFLLVLAGLLAWAFLGISYGSSPDWAVIISDVQATVSYVFDSLLMRQQLNAYDTHLRVCARLRSRSLSHRRMLRYIMRSDRWKAVDRTQSEGFEQVGLAPGLPAETWVGHISTLASKAMGHIITVGLFWAGIFVWLGFGNRMGWSDTWQLYINSATSAWMVLIFAFLANIRERHERYMDKCLAQIFEADSAIELKLRIITGDATPNPVVVIPGPKVSRLQRAIFYYADLVGTLVGVTILIVVLVVWLCIGPVMAFDSNWWLLIGTYAGLIGLNDGFVLRNVQARLDDYQQAAFGEVILDDSNVFVDTGIQPPVAEQAQDSSISCRLSVKLADICAHEITVVLGVLLIIGLIVGSSLMKWTETRQLLCNIPPSIVESFFMMILITGHNILDSRRRVDLHNLYTRRLRILAFVGRLVVVETKPSTGLEHEHIRQQGPEI